MTKQELIDRSLEEIDKLNQEETTDIDQLDFYADFVSKYTPFSIEMLKTLKYSDYFKASLNLLVDGVPFSKISNDVDKFAPLIDNMDKKDLSVLTKILTIIDEDNSYDKIIKCVKDDNHRRGFRLLKSLLFQHEEDMVPSYFELLVTEYDSTSVLTLLEYSKKYTDRVIGILFAIREMQKIVDEDNIMLEEMAKVKEEVRGTIYRLDERATNKEKDRLLKEKFPVDRVKDTFADIAKVYSDLNKDYRNKERDRTKKLSAYEEFVNCISTVFNKEEIVNYESIIKKISDDEIRLGFLRLVSQHNNVLYEDLESTYKELSKNSTVNYLALLKKYNISKDEIDLGKVMKNSCDDVSEMLDLIFNIIDDKITIIKAIQVTDLETCKYLKLLKAKGVLNTNTFKVYPGIFDANSTEFTMLNKNIETLNKYKINPAVFINNPEVLLGYSLEEKLAILEEYNLIKSMKSNGNYSYLVKDNLTGLIDKIIELGYERYLVDDLTLLNEDNWDRVYILKNIGEKVTKKSDLLAVLRDNDFIVSDYNISKYIANICPYYPYSDNLSSAALNEFAGTERAFNINGILISKNRFLRNYRENPKAPLLKNLVDGGIYSRDEVELVEKSITGTKEK